MSDDPANLSRLHDIVLPDPVSWWPPAPGWIVLLILLALFSVVFAFRRLRRWRADAYRRAALRELAGARSAAEIAEILRRTALAIAPREVIAGLQGKAWADWLGERSPEAMSEDAKTAISRSLYEPTLSTDHIESLRSFAGGWIRHHSPPC